VALLFPVLAFALLVGLCLCWIGQERDAGKRSKSSAEKVTVMPLYLEEPQQIE
jgi:hypothetical protein